jgi:hypothetical protein
MLKITVWHNALRDKTYLRHLRTVQRTELIIVLSAFTFVPHTKAQTLIVVPNTLTRTLGHKGRIFHPNKRKDL